MNTKYTPGPWETSVLSNGTQWEVCTEGGGDAIARMVPQRDVSREEHNARLIAEAPAMAEKLRAVVEAHDYAETVSVTEGRQCLADHIEDARIILARIDGAQS